MGITNVSSLTLTCLFEFFHIWKEHMVLIYNNLRKGPFALDDNDEYFYFVSACMNSKPNIGNHATYFWRHKNSRRWRQVRAATCDTKLKSINAM